MPSLYEIASQFAFLTGDGEIPEGWDEQVDATGISLKEKAEAYCRVIQELRSHASRFANEAARLIEISTGYEKNADRVAKRLLECLQLAGLSSLDTELFRLKVKISPPAVNCIGDPPPWFMRIKTAIEWDKDAVKRAWKADGSLPDGATITQGTKLVGVS